MARVQRVAQPIAQQVEGQNRDQDRQTGEGHDPPRPADELPDDKPETSKSWTLAEVQQFRTSVRDDRLFACWLLSCYGLRRSEILGLRWSALKGDTLSIRRSRVVVGNDAVEGMPKSREASETSPYPPSWLPLYRS